MEVIILCGLDRFSTTSKDLAGRQIHEISAGGVEGCGRGTRVRAWPQYTV